MSLCRLGVLAAPLRAPTVLIIFIDAVIVMDGCVGFVPEVVKRFAEADTTLVSAVGNRGGLQERQPCSAIVKCSRLS